MEKEDHLEKIVNGAKDQFAAVLGKSNQSVYIYLDDSHKVCNSNFASLLGYKSAAEWAKVKGNFPDLFVAKKSQRALISAFQNAMEKMSGSTIVVTWKKRNGEEVETTTMLVPIVYEGHQMALHFITQN